MQEFQPRKSGHKRLYSRLSIIILALLTVFLVRGAFEVYKKEKASEQGLAEAQNQLNEAQAHRAELQSNQSFLSSDAGVEHEIREKYSVAKPGEQVAIIVDPSTGTSTKQTVHISIWAKIGNWFRDIF